MLQELFDRPQYSLSPADKTRLLLAEMNALTRHHSEHCPEYRRLRRTLFVDMVDARSLGEVPYLPVSLFKSHRLASVPDNEVFKVLTSSATSGQEVSRVYLDRETARRQTVALTKIMTSVLGPQRLPMIILDAPSTVSDRKQFSARGAAILGMMPFGHSHLYAFDDRMELDVEALRRFLAKAAGGPFLLFGFTFIVWQYFCRRMREIGMDCSNGTLIHGGGWKKLEQESVTNDAFKRGLVTACGISRVYNFYGLVEQIGSIFLEGEDGYLHASNFGDVIVRDPITWEEVPAGTPGILQVMSALPSSYPGHALLTEDLGVVHGTDGSPSGRRGTYFSVLGRVPKTELRGCSDTRSLTAAT